MSEPMISRTTERAATTPSSPGSAYREGNPSISPQQFPERHRDILEEREWAERQAERREMVNHPAHYGGGDNPYEAIKVIEAWGLGFCLGNTVKYISRAGKKEDLLADLKKAAWYLNREIQRVSGEDAEGS